MITHEDLQKAIAECQGVRHPDAKTCIMLAAFYTIQEHLYGDEPKASYSEPPEIQPGAVSAISNSEFSDAIDGKPIYGVLEVIDELMQAVSVFNPRLYAATLRKLDEV